MSDEKQTEDTAPETPNSDDKQTATENTKTTETDDADATEITDEADDTPQDYPAPVNKLLSLGYPTGDFMKFDYYQMGIRTKDKPHLLRMIDDEDLHDADGESDLIWAPVHAWRALTQMQDPTVAGEMIEALFWRVEDDDDWVRNEMPQVMMLLGPKTLPALNAYLDPEKINGIYPRWLTVDCMVAIAETFPDMDRVVFAMLLGQLKNYEKHYPDVNAYMIVNLPPGEWLEDAKQIVLEAAKAEKVNLQILEDWGLLEITTTDGEKMNVREQRKRQEKQKRKEKRNKKRKEK